jgi:hypothetical protein
MKLIQQNQTYTHPNLMFGTFQNVIVEDVSIIHKRLEKYLSIIFEMSYLNNGLKVVLGTGSLSFLGMNDDEINSNQTAYVEVDGETIPLLQWLSENNGELGDAVITDYGYPTYEDALTYFDGGTFENPEITLTNPIAQGFVLNKLLINNEAVGTQLIFE